MDERPILKKFFRKLSMDARITSAYREPVQSTQELKADIQVFCGWKKSENVL